MMMKEQNTQQEEVLAQEFPTRLPKSATCTPKKNHLPHQTGLQGVDHLKDLGKQVSLVFLLAREAAKV